MKKALSVVFLALIVVLGFTACPEAGGSDEMAVGDAYGDYTVTLIDAEGGFMATKDGDDSMTEVLVTGVFTEDMTWSSASDSQYYYLEDAVFIGNDSEDSATTLTIEEGTLIKGRADSELPGALFITRHSMIMAEGTDSDPIVFTSAATTKARGDWGGIVINGLAQINDGDDNGEAEGEGGSGFYGGDDDTDNSGTLSYVRVEYAGTQFSGDDELNGIAFQAVGSGTTVDHIQVHMNADDGVEFFGGAVNASYIVITGAGDDSLDWTSGWTGTVDHAILQQYSDDGDRLLEGDSNKSNPTNTPVSNPILKNFTMIGNDDGDAVKFRRATNATLVNCIITGASEAAADTDSDGEMDDSTFEETDDSGDAGTVTYDGVLASEPSRESKAADWAAAITAETGAVTSDDHNLPAAALAGTSLDVTPSAAITNSTVSVSDDGAAYFGAVASDGTAWWSGWTTTN